MVRSVIRRLHGKFKELTQGTAPQPPAQESATESIKTERLPRHRAPSEQYEPRSAHRKTSREPTRDSDRGNPSPDKTAPAAQTVSSQTGSHAATPAEGDEPRRRRRRRRGGSGRSQQTGTDVGPATAPSSVETPDVPPTAWDPASFVVPLIEGKTRFQDLDLPDAILRAVFDLGFLYCTPIQAAILPNTLQGRDAYGRAQTGTGKSAAFIITILTHMLRNPLRGERKPGTPRALIIAPTRELAIQIENDAKGLARYTGARIVAVYGGMDYDKQRRMLGEQPVDIVIATPGRLLDFKQRHDLHLHKVEIMVIDEADRMLDMGFIPDVRRIIHSTPPRHDRQTLLLSATLSPDVIRLASQWTQDPVTIEIEPEQVAVDTVEQLVYIVTAREKFPLLYNLVVKQDLQRVMVFVNRRDQVRKLTEALQDHGIECEMLTGDVPQKKRLQTLESFREGRIRVMVATDVAGRGIHIEGVSHVVNYTLPMDPEDYVHRIGRTGRAGASGISVSFACESDSFHIPDIETFIGRDLKCTHPDESLLEPPPPARPRKRPPPEESRSRSGGPRGGGRSRRGGSGRPRSR